MGLRSLVVSQLSSCQSGCAQRIAVGGISACHPCLDAFVMSPIRGKTVRLGPGDASTPSGTPSATPAPNPRGWGGCRDAYISRMLGLSHHLRPDPEDPRDPRCPEEPRPLHIIFANATQVGQISAGKMSATYINIIDLPVQGNVDAQLPRNCPLEACQHGLKPAMLCTIQSTVGEH